MQIGEIGKREGHRPCISTLQLLPSSSCEQTSSGHWFPSIPINPQTPHTAERVLRNHLENTHLKSLRLSKSAPKQKDLVKGNMICLPLPFHLIRESWCCCWETQSAVRQRHCDQLLSIALFLCLQPVVTGKIFSTEQV